MGVRRELHALRTALHDGGAYTLARNNHVRGDFLYRRLVAAAAGSIDLVLYFLFFFPGILALVYAGIPFAQMSG